MPILDVDGLNLNAQVLGSGSPLLTLHGLLIGNLSSWYPAAGSLASSRRQVVLYDQRGHGRSTLAPTGYGLVSMASDLAGLLDALAIQGPVDLAGFSYGSLIALRFTLDRPNLVRRLILVETLLPPLGALVDRNLNADLPSLLSALPAAARKLVSASPHRVMAAVRRTQRLIQETSLVADVRAEPALSESELRRLAVPTLCLQGSDSEFRADGELLASMLPECRLEIIPGSHWLLNDNPSRATDLIKEFLDG
jgi:pimeloyl-ACP methyl ester carboxylesterase